MLHFDYMKLLINCLKFSLVILGRGDKVSFWDEHWLINYSSNQLILKFTGSASSSNWNLNVRRKFSGLEIEEWFSILSFLMNFTFSD